MAQYKSRGGGAGPGPLGFYGARGAGLMGLSPNDPSIAFMFDDFMQEPATNSLFGWLAGGGGSASTTTQIAGLGGGNVMLNTGASAASNAQWTEVSGQASSITASRWYHASRFRITTTPDNQTTGLIGLINQAATKTIACGVVGTLDAAHFVLQYDGNAAGSFLSLGKNIDTSFHVFEAWGVGSTVVNASIDGGAVVQVTQAAAPADYLASIITIRNGTTAASQQLQADWALTMGVRS